MLTRHARANASERVPKENKDRQLGKSGAQKANALRASSERVLGEIEEGSEAGLASVQEIVEDLSVAKRGTGACKDVVRLEPCQHQVGERPSTSFEPSFLLSPETAEQKPQM